MTLTILLIIEAIIQQNVYTRKKSTETVETFLDLIKSTFASGDNILISGFGKFCMKEKQERKGGNPVTGDDMSWGRDGLWGSSVRGS